MKMNFPSEVKWVTTLPLVGFSGFDLHARWVLLAKAKVSTTTAACPSYIYTTGRYKIWKKLT